MAAATKTIAPSRPVFVPEELPKDSKLDCLMKLTKVVSPEMRRKLIKEGHKLISSAKSMTDLGYSETLYIDKGHYIDTNTNNYRLTVDVLECDEGLFAHLLNKVTKLINVEGLPRDDHLGIMYWPRGGVYNALYPCDDSDVCLLGKPAMAAVANYTNAMTNAMMNTIMRMH